MVPVSFVHEGVVLFKVIEETSAVHPDGIYVNRGRVGHLDEVTHSTAEAVSAFGVAESVLREGGPYIGWIVSLAAKLVGVPVEGVERYKAVIQASARNTRSDEDEHKGKDYLFRLRPPFQVGERWHGRLTVRRVFLQKGLAPDSP